MTGTGAPSTPGASVSIERSVGSAHEFHHRPITTGGGPAIWIHAVDRPAIVLGSSQRDDVIDRAAAEAAGFEVTGRRSGGGIVVVEPHESCWVDVLIPRGHPHWTDDVIRAFDVVGAWWRSALTALGVTDLVVHGDGIVDREFGRAVCFAGLGPGEVIRRTGNDPPAKVVGLSQRRTRDAARFQGLYLRRWNPDPIRRFVRADSLPDGLDLDAVAAGLPGGPGPAAVVDAVVPVMIDALG